MQKQHIKKKNTSTKGQHFFFPYHRELFSYYLKKRDGRYYVAVQLIGTSSEASKYKCEFTLRAANGIEQISKTFLVQTIQRTLRQFLILENVSILMKKQQKFLL